MSTALAGICLHSVQKRDFQAKAGSSAFMLRNWPHVCCW